MIAQPGVASMAAYLRARGHEVHVLDARIEKLDATGLAGRVVALKPDYVGLTSITAEIHDSAAVAAAIKCLAPGVVTVVGGVHASALPVRTLEEFESFDIAVAGEGEIPLGEIVDGRPWGEIHGIVFRNGDGSVVSNPPQEKSVSLDDLPPPAWDLYDLQRYQAPLAVEFVRGCPFPCTFCFRTADRRARLRSPESSLDMLEFLTRKYPVREWYFSSNGTWPLGRAHGIKVCEGILARGLKIRWSASVRVDLVDEELLALMRRAGCGFVDFGIESADGDVLRAAAKGLNNEQTERIVKACYKLGIETELNFLIGLPFETRETIESTRRLVATLRRWSTLANFAILVPYPGTRVWDMATRNEGGIRFKTMDWREYTKQSGRAVVHENFKEGELVKLQTSLYMTYYLGSPRKVLQLVTSRNARILLQPRRALQLLQKVAL